MRIGLFGGSFNPPHIGHLVVAEQAREQARLDRVIWMPAFSPPHKEARSLPSASHRVAMCRLATVGHPAFEVSELETDRGGVSYTVDTLRTLVSLWPEAEFRLIIGGDSMAEFGTWREPEGIVAIAPLLVYPRPGYELDASGLPERTRVLETPMIDVSASLVRGRVRDGRAIRYLVPEAVRSYIEDHGLYR